MRDRLGDLLRSASPDAHEQLRELAEREDRTQMNVAILIVRWGLLQNAKGITISAMADELFEDKKCRELKQSIPSNG